MPSLLDIRRRIRAVKSTQQITKAMKMISASKLRRAKDRVTGARPFAWQMARVLSGLAERVDPSTHPLLAQPEPREDARTLLIVVTADKGLCGGFNTNIIKAAGGFIAGTGANGIELGLVGRKGRDFFRRRGFEVRIEEIGIFQKVRYADAQRIAQTAIEEFTSGRASNVSIVYNEFKSVMQQRVAIERLLPIPRGALESAGAPGTTGFPSPAAAFGVPGGARAEGNVDYLYEPAPAKIFAELLPRHIEIQIYRALLESAAAEHAARMTAMDAATKNSGEIIENLTLYMNKVRQAAITREIIEVVSGAQSTS
ncbi:MAG TPA: ATP synthase F1 subunit gamma [Vicinamibacterales bacterium]|jgi:F-type H+-transporting ATPase subunit gamma|nr:ATP synthase F1 subunit gamma [Vicinamibacterales bacterium]